MPKADGSPTAKELRARGNAVYAKKLAAARAKWIKHTLKNLPDDVKEEAGFREAAEAIAALVGPTGVSVATEVMLRTVQTALFDPDSRVALAAQAELANRAEGTPKQHVDLTSKGKSIRPDLSKLSVDELETMMTLSEKIHDPEAGADSA